MYCAKCGNQLKQTAAFCGNCGNPIRQNVLPTQPKKAFLSNKLIFAGLSATVVVIAIATFAVFWLLNEADNNDQIDSVALAQDLQNESTERPETTILEETEEEPAENTTQIEPASVLTDEEAEDTQTSAEYLEVAQEPQNFASFASFEIISLPEEVAAEHLAYIRHWFSYTQNNITNGVLDEIHIDHIATFHLRPDGTFSRIRIHPGFMGDTRVRDYFFDSHNNLLFVFMRQFGEIIGTRLYFYDNHIFRYLDEDNIDIAHTVDDLTFQNLVWLLETDLSLRFEY